MVQYIYFVKCPNCEDEPFDFFNDAKDFALGCLSSKPVITQVEVNRNDFGECTDSADLGTVWSWEDMMNDIPAEQENTVFNKSETFNCCAGCDSEFDSFNNSLDGIPDNFRKPVCENIASSTRALLDSDFVIVSKLPNRNAYSFLGTNYRMTSQLEKAMPYSTKEEAEYDITYAEDQCGSSYDRYTSDRFFVATVKEVKQLLDDIRWRNAKQLSIDDMTIEALVEEMEKNEDMVECKNCEELFDKSECIHDKDYGWLCYPCQADRAKQHGGDIVISQPPEEVEDSEDNTWYCVFDGEWIGAVIAETEDEALERMQKEYPEYPYGMYDGCFWVTKYL
jgi:hypothetical protein